MPRLRASEISDALAGIAYTTHALEESIELLTEEVVNASESGKQWLSNLE